jgi:hypothetical protein
MAAQSCQLRGRLQTGRCREDNQSSQTTLMQQVLDIPQSQRVADIHHHRQADELGARLEVAEDAGAAHTLKATGSHPRRKPILL